MSVEIYKPFGEFGPEYKIGYEGLEHGREGLSGIILELFRKAYPLLPVQSILGTLLVGGSVDVAVPTYGLWAGPGWNAGTRPPEGGTIEWETLPCYNNNIKNIENNPELNPYDCISLVDAICKAHDWRYSEADALYKNDSEGRENAKRSADILMLQDIAVACELNSYKEIVGTWEKKTYTNTFDSSEVIYLAKLVPLFFGKIALSAALNDALSDVSIAYTALIVILPFIPIDGAVLQDPSNPTTKTVFHVVNNLMITQKESESGSELCIVDMNGVAKPVRVNIIYGEGSTKAEDLFVIGDDGVIRINSGTGQNEIRITGAKNDTSSSYTFEINDGGGNDTYYLDSNFNYRMIDAEANAIYIQDENGNWKRIVNLYETSTGAWTSTDGKITLTGSTITLTNGGTIDLNGTDPEDYGINLLPLNGNPQLANTLLGDLAPVDFDPETEGIQTQEDEWGNVIVSSQASPGMEDAIYDTTDNDLIDSGAGNDFISSSRGGDDWIKGGAGNDYITAQYHSGNMLIEGGSGQDIAYGGRGNDKIYGEDKQTGMSYYEEMTFLIAAGEIAASSEDRGDALSGGSGQIVGERQVTDGDDYLYGSNAIDVLMGGTGKDLIVGGGGNTFLALIVFNNSMDNHIHLNVTSAHYETYRRAA